MSVFKYSIYIVFILSLFALACTNKPKASNDEELTQAEAEKKINELGEQCWNLRLKSSDSASVFGERALSLAQKYNITEPVPRISNYLGVVYIHCLHKERFSVRFFHQALETGIQLKDSVQIAYAYNNLGDTYLLNENVPISILYGEKSLQLFEQLNNLRGIAYAYVNLGIAHRIGKNYKQSNYYFKLGKNIREKNGDKVGLASLFFEIGRNYLEQNKLDSAMIYFQDSYQKHIVLENEIYQAYCLNGIANIYYKSDQFDTAISYFNKSIELNQKKSHYYGLTDNYNGLALVFAKQNKKAKGETALNMAMEMSNIVGLSNKTLFTHQNFAKFYQILSDYEHASNSLVQFIQLYDSILDVQQVATLEELQNNFSVRQNLLSVQNELASNKSERIYLLIIIALLLILFSLGYMRLRANHRLNKQLKQINILKDKMFSVISHDLKSPFNSLLGFSNLLKEELEKNNYNNIKTYSEIIHRKSEESLKLLTNLLTWSQSQTGRIIFNPQNQSIDKLFKELKDFFEIDALNNEIVLSFTNSISQNVKYDTDILRIVLVNLISNSMKYTDQKGLIKVSASKTESQIILKVVDTGIGISNSTLQNLFKSSQMIQSVEGLRKEHGTGLGLLIVSELVQIHMGQIEAKSELGKGSVFEISLPILID